MFFFFPSIINRFPLGYSGLYALMAEKLLQNHFIPPLSVPFYDQGSVPFVYPPFGFYMAALATAAGIPMLDYLRGVSPLLGVFCLVVLYQFSLELSARRSKAILTVLFFCTSYEVFEKQVEAAGMVRGWALLFCLLCLLFMLKSIRTRGQNKNDLVLAALFLGLTALTHLSYLLFTLLLMVLFCVFTAPKSFYKYGLLILAGGMLIASPWVLQTLIRFGPQVYTGALKSHNNFALIDSLRQSKLLASNPFFMFKDWLGTSLIGLAVLGVLAGVWKRQWAIVLGIILSYLYIGEGERFVVLLAAILVADLCIDILDHILDSGGKRLPFSLVCLSIIILIMNLFLFNYPDQWASPTLNQSVILMTNWLKQNSPQQSSFILLSPDHNLGEWIPYLSSRTTLIGYWGSEWKESYPRDVDNWNRVASCTSNQLLSCFNQVVTDNQLTPDYLISPRSYSTLSSQILQSHDWQLAYQNDQYLVYARIVK